MSIYKSSNVIIRVLEWLLPSDMTHLIGDLEEELYNDLERYSALQAYLLFLYRCTVSIPLFLYQSLKWNVVMITNYIKVALRNIKKYKSFSVINVLGLAVSISICLLIILFIYDQKNYDRFHEDKDRIYRITSEFKSSGNFSTHRYATSPANLVDILREDYPSVETATTIRRRIGGEADAGGKVIRVNGLYGDSNFLDVFSFDLLLGDPESALSNPGSIILSKETADKFFGSQDPIGEEFRIIGRGDFVITGVIDTDVRSHLTFDVLASYSTLLSNEQYRSIYIDNWRNSFYSSYTYFKLKKNADIEDLAVQLPGLIETHYDSTPESYLAEFIIQPLTKINIGDSMDNQLGSVMPRLPVYFLIGFAGIIIFVACFNYVGLTVARGLSRGKEVGVRKALGANKGSVVGQFLIEAILIALFSLVFASVFLIYLLPEFNDLQFIRMELTRGISFDIVKDYPVYISFLSFTVIVGLLAGLFPALHLSSIKSAIVLKGLENKKGISKSHIRKGLVVIQFVFSLVFIITALFLNRQFNQFLNAEYGFDAEHIIQLELQDMPYDRVKTWMLGNPNVASVSGTSVVPALNSRSDRRISSDQIEYDAEANHFSVDEEYIPNMKLNLVAGRNFSADLATDVNGPFILSRKAVADLGYSSPQDAVGKYVAFSDSTYPVIGVIEDFVSSDITVETEGVMMQYQPEYIETASIKVLPGQLATVTNYINEEWDDLGSQYSARYAFYTDQLGETYSLLLFNDLAQVVKSVAFFSILISCLGLFGMAMFNAESRTKEIGIRKVMGASDRDIVFLLSKEYLLLIAISIAISLPLTYLFNSFLLQQVANRIELSPLVFLAGIFVTLVLALITAGSQSLRAAKANSIDNLRFE